MTVMGYTVDKVNVDIRSRDFNKGQINVGNSFSIPEVVKLDNKSLKIDWTFETDYQEIAKMSLAGTLMYSSDDISKAYEERVPEKSKDKKKRMFLSGNALEEVSNFVIRRGIVESTVLSRFLMLPVPLKLPTVKIEKKAPSK